MKTVTFIYIYKNWNKNEIQINYPINIPFKDDPNELSHRLVAENMDPIMNISNEAYKAVQLVLKDFIREQNQIFYDDRDEELLKRVRANEINFDLIIRDTEKLYKDETLEFADRGGLHYNWTDNEIFAQSFHRLVHSSSLPDLLTKEKAYAKIITEMNLK
jgi:hypothetical protein